MIVDFIDEYRDATGGSTPTGAEIAAGVGLAASTVSKYMSYMKEQGIIEYESRRKITTERARREAFGFCTVPVLGAVSCGIPKLAEENIEEYVKLPISLFGRGDFFILRAKGDSMINADIADGDLVIVKQQNTAEYNQIVVALVDDDATLKRFRPCADGIHLHAENPNYEDIILDSCIIQGVAVKVIKDVL